MCGRYTLHSRLNLLLQQFAVEAGPEWAPRYNVAPTQMAPIVRMRPDGGPRELVPLRWGLVPSWAKEVSIGNRMINARAETVATKPSFRSALRRRRCLVPTDGYFEWKKTPHGKQPYYIRLQAETPFAMAGLWEHWHAGQSDALQTFTVITTESNEATADIHDRMPVILAPEDYETWLDPDLQAPEPLLALLRPFESSEMKLDPVSTRVNSPRHDDPSCIEVQPELF